MMPWQRAQPVIAKLAIVASLTLVGWPVGWSVSWPQAARADAAATSVDRGLVSALQDPQAAAQAAAPVRGASGLSSTLEPADLESRLGRLLSWMVRDFARSGSLRLLSAAPTGVNGADRSNPRLRTLTSTYWLQDNGSYGAAAFLQYAPPLEKLLSASIAEKWEAKFPSFCPVTESSVVAGILPPYETGGDGGDPRCRLPKPGPWQMLRMSQYPSPADPGFDALPTPIIGTDYPAKANGTVPQMAAISRESPRDLLKYGCLRQVLLGNKALAEDMFDLALAQWDGHGFLEPKRRHDQEGNLSGIYWTRDLAFALMCANALGQGDQAMLGTRHQVSKGLLEEKLWASQSSTGGVWSNYCEADGACASGRIPAMAKQTNEIAPLVLLAYGRNIWLAR